MRALLLCLALAGCAQPTQISTGMTEAELTAKLGTPASKYESTASTTKRLHYGDFDAVVTDGIVTEIISYR